MLVRMRVRRSKCATPAIVIYQASNNAENIMNKEACLDDKIKKKFFY